MTKTSDEISATIAALRHSIELNPNQVDAYIELGQNLIQLGQADAAIEATRKAISLDPNLPVAHSNLGACLRFAGQYEEAAAACRRALELQPNYAHAQTNLGAALSEMGRDAEAIGLHEAAIAREPNVGVAHWNLAMACLRSGELKRGFAEYEWRLRDADGITLPKYNSPRWDGSPLAGKTLLVQGEQGMGDIIQFIRYVPLIAARGGKIIIVCHPELCRLLGKTQYVMQAIPFQAPPPPHDVHCAMLSLPYLFGTTLATVPAYTPYLYPPGDLIARWRDQLGPKTTPRIGLAWGVRADYKNDSARGVGGLQQFAPLAAVPGIEFHSLQKGPAAQEANNPPAGMKLVDHNDELNDFADTAALMAHMDLIISVDSAPAHLAGAIGKQVWTLIPAQPDWRWMRQRSDNPWYPTMTLFRQKLRGDWSEVIGRIKLALMTGQRRAPAV